MASASARCFGSRLINIRHFSWVKTPNRGFDRSRVELCEHFHKPLVSQWRGRFRYPEIESQESARLAVLSLSDEGRELLMKELKKLEDSRARSVDQPVTVSASKLWGVFLFNGVPFVGFGLLDNLIMILAGEYIDVTLGVTLGISTMAAAALGNLVSDVAGVGAGGYIELLAEKLGFRAPDLTPAETTTRQTRWSVALGRAVGVSLGCLIGMFPLLFFDDRDDDDDEDAHKKKTSQSTATQTEQTATNTANSFTKHSHSSIQVLPISKSSETTMLS